MRVERTGERTKKGTGPAREETETVVALRKLVECFDGFDAAREGAVMNERMAWEDVAPRVERARAALAAASLPTGDGQRVPEVVRTRLEHADVALSYLDATPVDDSARGAHLDEAHRAVADALDALAIAPPSEDGKRGELEDAGDRLYRALALVDTRDGTPLAHIIRAARASAGGTGWLRRLSAR